MGQQIVIVLRDKLFFFTGRMLSMYICMLGKIITENWLQTRHSHTSRIDIQSFLLHNKEVSRSCTCLPVSHTPTHPVVYCCFVQRATPWVFLSFMLDDISSQCYCFTWILYTGIRLFTSVCLRVDEVVSQFCAHVCECVIGLRVPGLCAQTGYFWLAISLTELN